DDTADLKVTGVYEDLPFNSSFSDLGFIAPWDLAVVLNAEIGGDANQHIWSDNPVQVFVELKAGADFSKISGKIAKVIADKPGPAGSQKESVVLLHPMSDWHLYSEFKNGKNAGGRIQYVWLFGFIGLFILALACINFMNLSTARSGKRGREVGVRKAIGSSRGQLMSQFFIESLTVALIAFVFSMLFVLLALPFFNRLTGKEMSILWQSPVFWISVIGFALFTGMIAGSYPALYLSAFRPVQVLKGSVSGGRSAAGLRKILVTLQFSISVILAIGTLIVYQQIRYARNRPVGYDRSGLVLTRLSSQDIFKHFPAFREDLLQTGVVAEAAESTSFTTEVMNIDEGLKWEGWDSTRPADITMEGITYEYGKTVGWDLKEGRDYSRNFSSDAMSMVINETAARIMNLGNPVGKTLRWLGARFTIIGVVRDMVMESPYTPTLPTVYYIAPWWTPVVNIRLKPGAGAGDALTRIERVFKKYDATEPFNFVFADAEYDAKFRAEQRVGSLAGFFCSFAIFISCLGLFGLVSFITEQRTKEISVRKVLGASVFGLWRLLSREFLILVLLSECIAIPIGYYFMHNWLQNYSYRTGISWWILLAAGAGALVITLVTVSFQSIKAAMANPVKALRSE
ncbi:MAG TPA: FtsX-like permease family protein, partial [Puia sp.]|nr:FtsX-like permease family protein [Puia sp.]